MTDTVFIGDEITAAAFRLAAAHLEGHYHELVNAELLEVGHIFIGERIRERH